ncbi:nuclear protein [Multifurca ochricompacta]|uniref:Nuclear protein n=1 Tax=Multifurca ochricompacta TaxID=376703 RepID=A0AAD4MCS4_9AGAM|nr:nuclear protein [Multifurca ochricompacta]
MESRLVVGSVIGAIGLVFDKMLAIHKKHGPFSFALCIGDFFGLLPEGNNASDLGRLLGGELKAPLPCYIMQGELPLPDVVVEQFSQKNGELCDNVFLLSKSATITTVEGLRIACLGGTYKPEVYGQSRITHGFSSPYFTAQTVSKLLSDTVSTPMPRASSLSNTSYSFVDVLISHDWPSVISEFSAVPLPSPELCNVGSPPINEIIVKTKPRYIFCSGGVKPPRFWEREPFTWTDEADRVSRFVSLGAFGGEPNDGRKQRWFYAFAITPNVQTTGESQMPANATPNPFIDSPRADKRPFEAAEGGNYRWGDVERPWKRSNRGGEQGKLPLGYRCKRCDGTDHFINACPKRAHPPQNYICKICNNPGHFLRDCPTRHASGDTGGRKPRKGYVCRACGSELHYIEDCPIVQGRYASNNNRDHPERGPSREVGPDECWFCLSNPALAKHLIVAVGGECYLTFPKGQLIPTRSAGQHENMDIPKVPGGGHVLIVPIAHFPTLNAIPSELRASIHNESSKYQGALRALYASHGATAVFFEVGRVSAKGGHAHIQAVPVPLSLEDRVEFAFRDAGALHGVEFDQEELDELPSGGEGEEYFRVELPSGRRLVHRIRGPFSVQFGRKVLASLLNVEERVDWKTCLQSEEDDMTDVLAFKTAFAPFDPFC